MEGMVRNYCNAKRGRAYNAGSVGTAASFAQDLDLSHAQSAGRQLYFSRNINRLSTSPLGMVLHRNLRADLRQPSGGDSECSAKPVQRSAQLAILNEPGWFCRK
jgi:hypothetical protein